MKTTRITAIFALVVAVGAVGVTTAIMDTVTPAHAGGCIVHTPGAGKNAAVVCPPLPGQGGLEPGGFVCNHGSGCRDIATRIGNP
jgi:hypothetical protein